MLDPPARTVSRHQHLRAQRLQIANSSLQLGRLRISKVKPTNNRIQRDTPTGHINRMPRRINHTGMAAPGKHHQALAAHARQHQPLIANQRILNPRGRLRIEAQPAPQPRLVRRAPRDLAAGEEGAVAHGVGLGVQRGRAAGRRDRRERRVRLQRDGAVRAQEAAEGRPVRVQVHWERRRGAAGARLGRGDELDCAQHAAWGC